MLRVEDTAGRLAREVVVGPTPILPVWSPVTDHLAYVVSGADAQGVWLLDMAGGEPRPLASGYREVGAMAWSGNGERLAFSAQSRVVGQRLDRLAPHNLYTVQADGNGLAVARRGFGAYVNNFSRFCALAWG
jgi:Tol biopolymer transport system component